MSDRLCLFCLLVRYIPVRPKLNGTIRTHDATFVAVVIQDIEKKEREELEQNRQSEEADLKVRTNRRLRFCRAVRDKGRKELAHGDNTGRSSLAWGGLR